MKKRIKPVSFWMGFKKITGVAVVETKVHNARVVQLSFYRALLTATALFGATACATSKDVRNWLFHLAKPPQPRHP